MESQRRPVYSAVRLRPTRVMKAPARSDGEAQSNFIISSHTLNMIDVVYEGEEKKVPFPGNISPEGYFYSPFYEVDIKELEDEPQYVRAIRINFNPSDECTNVIASSMTFYDPQIGIFEERCLNIFTVKSPTSYDFIAGRPFCIYDVLEDMTYRGYLDGFSANTDGSCNVNITLDTGIPCSGGDLTLLFSPEDLRGTETSGKSRYIISMLEDNAPEYAEFVPSTQRLIWRAPKKMSDLDNTSPLYDMPFTNGRLYINRNVNVFLRRQDPDGAYKLYSPSVANPLKRFQVEGGKKLDFDYINYIIDSMVDAC